MQTQAAVPQTARLAAGQSFHLQAGAGACIAVKSGRIDVVERSIWLCDRFVTQGGTVRDGEQYTLQQSGWIALQAREPTILFYIERDTKADADRRLLRLVACAARFLRRGFGSAA
jgi:hypothetical protein